MSRYRKVDPRIWNDEKFRKLNNHGKLLFFMLLTHPNMTALGAMRATPAGLAEELGWEAEAFRKAFADVLSKAMAEHDAEACLIALPNFIRYNQPESPNVIKAWVGALDLLPECQLKRHVLQRAQAIVSEMTEGFSKAFGEAFAQAMPYPKQKPKQKPKKKNPPPPSDEGGAFDAFWSAWPTHKRKVAEVQCRRKWKAKGCQSVADAVMAALEVAKASKDWTKDDGEFIPAPLTWLNQARWEAPTEAESAQEQQGKHWHESRAGIEAKGEELHLGRWDESAFHLGRGESWPVYRTRVFRAAGHEPLRAAA